MPQPAVRRMVRRYMVTTDAKQHIFVQQGDGVDPASPDAPPRGAPAPPNHGGEGEAAQTAGPNHAFQSNLRTIRTAIGLDPYESLGPEQVIRLR
jgi:hypothetical protein